MPVRPLRSITVRYAALAVGIPFLLMLLLWACWLLPQVRRDLDNNQRQLAVAVASEVESYLGNARAIIGSIASFYDESHTPAEMLRAQRLLDKNVGALKRLNTCYLVDRAGRVVAVSMAGAPVNQRDLLGIDLSNNPLYTATVKERREQWSNSYLSLVGGGISVALAVPVGDRVFIGELELARLSRYLERISILKDQKIFVLDRRGQGIADREGSYTAQQLNLNNLPLVRQGVQGNRLITGEFDFEGRPMAGSLCRIPESSWSVLVAQPRKQAHRQLFTTANIAGLGLIAALLLAAALALIFTRTLVRRFEELAEHARSAENSKAPTDWPICRIAEFNTLAAGLQRMSGTLQERAQLLELEVQERLLIEEDLREKNEELAAVEEELRQQVDELFAAQKELMKSEEAYRTVADWTYDWEYWLSPEQKFHYMSPSCERITGYSAQAFLADPGLFLRIVHPDDRQDMQQHLDSCALPGAHAPLELETLEFKLLTRDGSTLWIEHSCRSVFSEEGRYLGRRACNRDMTERRVLEQQLHQQQKLEGIGLLAGGIAHDFNNMLLPILFCAEMIAMQYPEDELIRKRSTMILDAGNKAKDLVRQLLTFSHKQDLQFLPYDLNEIVRSFSTMLRRTVRENIELSEQLSSANCSILADRIQIEQILLNLMVNATDAISGNGTIKVETGHVVFEDEYCHLHPGTLPGKYVMLAFGDSGCGMDDATLSHIFEPFFTTKPVGRGTGLGLSTTYGIVKQHGGTIDVLSARERGTTFRIYFPEAKESGLRRLEKVKVRETQITQCAVILVVEDNAMVLEMVREILEGEGYRVLAASLPDAALELVRASGRPVDLLVSDVVMPQMSGPELHERLADLVPGVRGLFMSGYASSSVVHKGQLREGSNFISKPFTAEALLAKVEEFLLTSPDSPGPN